jgi:hypothetical protein
MSAADRTPLELRSEPRSALDGGAVSGRCEQQQPTNAVARNSFQLQQICINRNTQS